jgi:hypothetical protein
LHSSLNLSPLSKLLKTFVFKTEEYNFLKLILIFGIFPSVLQFFLSKNLGRGQMPVLPFPPYGIHVYDPGLILRGGKEFCIGYHAEYLITHSIIELV